MNKLLLLNLKKQWRAAGIIRALLIALLGIAVLPILSQVGSPENYIFITGQVTNSVSGTPIPDHDVYIQSDSALNNGFLYSVTVKTDLNGFYWDTIVATSNVGIINFSVYDYNDELIEVDRYYRFLWENEYVMIADFSIFDPNTIVDLQANFGTDNDTIENNPLKIIFNDSSIGGMIKSWIWDFGDGSFSEEKDPVHIYELPGLYLVKLTISVLPAGFEHYLQSTIVKQVHVGYELFYHLGGHVFAEYFPIDLGLAYLYTYDAEDVLIPIDTTQIDTLGYYYFYQLPAGKYLTKARLQATSGLYGQFMPTYLGNEFNWNYAQPIILDNNNWECDISLLPSTGIYSGSGEILGQITYDTSRTSMSVTPAGDIEILLLSEQGMNLTCGISDLEGYFTFSDIAFGTYQLFPDVAGISNAPMFVTLNEDAPFINNISLVIHTGDVTFSINDPKSDFIEQAVLIYPNPAKDQARINVRMKKTSQLCIMITDLQGRTVYRQESSFNEGNNEITLDVRKFPAGCYQVLLMPQDKKIINGKLLKFN